jgi:hypothetical protein
LAKPEYLNDFYIDQRWRKYLMNLGDKDLSGYRLYFGRYLCRRWNENRSRREDNLDKFTINFMMRTTQPSGLAPLEKKEVLWEHFCFK